MKTSNLPFVGWRKLTMRRLLHCLREITDEAGMINFEGDPIEENVELRRVLAQKKEIKEMKQGIRKDARE